MGKKEVTIPFFPAGTVEVSRDAISWNPIGPDIKGIRYAKTKAGKFFRKPKDCRDYRDWRPVTSAHIDAAAREGWYTKGDQDG